MRDNCSHRYIFLISASQMEGHKIGFKPNTQAIYMNLTPFLVSADNQMIVFRLSMQWFYLVGIVHLKNASAVIVFCCITCIDNDVISWMAKPS